MPVTGAQMLAFDLKACRLIRNDFTLHVPKIGLLKVYHDISHNWQLDDLVEADFPGYSRKDLINWTDPVIISGVAQMNPDPVTWTNTGGVSAPNQGWFILDGADLTSVIFGAPYDLPPIAPAGSFTISPLYTLTDGYIFG